MMQKIPPILNLADTLMKGELETNYAEIKDNIKKWKTKARVSTKKK